MDNLCERCFSSVEDSSIELCQECIDTDKSTIKIQDGYIIRGDNLQAIEEMQEQGYTLAMFEGTLTKVHVVDNRFVKWENNMSSETQWDLIGVEMQQDHASEDIDEPENGCVICLEDKPLDKDGWCDDCNNIDLDEVEERRRQRIMEAQEY